MRRVSPDEAIDEAKRGALKPVYVVVGEERHQQSTVLKALSSAVLDGAVPGLNEDHLIAGDADVDAVLTAARTMPMMAARRLVVVRHVDRWEPKSKPGKGKKKKKAGAEGALDRLAEYAEDPAPEATLILLADKLDKRRRLVSAAAKGGWLVSCEPLKPHELPRWIAREAKRRGFDLAPGVSELLAELTGPELSAVIDALERVGLYVGPGSPVTEEAVGECIVRVRPATIWELVDAVGRRDAGAALATLSEVYDPADRGLRLVPVLAWSARQLLKFESATCAGASPDTAAKRAGAPPFKAKQFAQQLRRTSRRDLERWLEMLARVDLALKGGSARPPRAVLEHALIAMCSAGRSRRARPSA